MQHREVKEGDIHVIHNFKFLNESERDSYQVKAEDLNKVCLVVEPYGFFALKSIEPIEWKPLSTVTVNVEDFEVYTKEQINTLLSKKIESYNISSSEFRCGYTRNGKEVFGLEVDCGALGNAVEKTIEIPNYNYNYDYWINYGESKCEAMPPKKGRISPNYTNIYLGRSLTTLISSPNQNLITIQSNWDASGFKAIIVLNYTKE
ncbi:MAG: hypothetical protein JW802_05555 [Campylobacterales bacterium]|nr:hypothetical protein [Campylobacterales bacterium]MBN2832581.1 hypothetical protein [Campylobacterales bacterium]